MSVDHTVPQAVYSRVVASLEGLHRALDRTADNHGLREGTTLADAHRRLSRLADELTSLTGQDLAHLLTYPSPPGTGELFLGSAELLATARAAEWWHAESTPEEADLHPVGAAAYL